MTVFCVEHGRWSPATVGFNSAGTIAHPAIRLEAQTAKSQAGVWDSVAKAAQAFRVDSPTSSYQDVVDSPQTKRRFDEVASSIEADYERELREQLRSRDAVGIVVAINGRLVWSDIFSTHELFQKYWPKLLRSYVMEAEGRETSVKRLPSSKEALAFLLEDRGQVNVHVEPGVYRRSEISASDYHIIAIEALGPFGDEGLLVHYNKMVRD